MSLVDDQTAEIDAQLLRALEKCRYGRRYSPAYELALEIKTLRQFLSDRNHSAADRLTLLWNKVETMWLDVFEQKPGLDVKELYDIRVALRTAWILLIAAITTSKKLREVADALDAAPADDPRQANILKAYADCIEGRYRPTVAEKTDRFVKCYLPTLAQLREAFVERFGEKSWPRDFSVRKTLRLLGLELTKAKRGRPVGSGSKIGNPRRLER
jgi:hypothetical protein